MLIHLAVKLKTILSYVVVGLPRAYSHDVTDIRALWGFVVSVDRFRIPRDVGQTTDVDDLIPHALQPQMSDTTSTWVAELLVPRIFDRRVHFEAYD